MTNVVKFISRGLDSVQNKVYPNVNNTLSQIADPARKLRSVSDKGGGINTAAVLDPNNVFTQKNTTTNASKAQDALNKQLAIPSAPNQDTAANANQQNLDAQRRRRGVLANIYAGGQSSTLG